MSKRTHSTASSNASQPAAPKQAGLLAFRRGDFSAAILAWEKLDPAAAPAAAPEVRAALAEAYFRRALAAREDQARLKDLQQAVELLPTEARFWYHLGLAQHRVQQFAEALAAYARAADLGYARPEALALVRALARMEADPAGERLSPDTPTIPEPVQLFPVRALLQGRPHLILEAQAGGVWNKFKTALQDQAPALLWRGLAFFAEGDLAQAQQTLAAISPTALPPEAEAVRAFYCGLALVHTGQAAAALPLWLNAQKRAPTPALEDALAGVGVQATRAALEAGDAARAVTLADNALNSMPDHLGLRVAAAIARGRLAQTAVAQEHWAEAILHWSHLSALLEPKPLAPGRLPVLRNLAIVHETLEQWEGAAEAWGDLLRALPKREPKAKKTKTPSVETPLAGPLLAEQRLWLRRRILDNYQKAGRPDQAIVYYKQAVKANPDDLDLRLELAAALLANEQEVAARNELNRILKLDPQHLEARVRLAELQQMRGEFYLAEQSLRAVLAQDPNFAAARRSLVELLRDRGHDLSNAEREADARQAYAEALSMAPNDIDLLTSLGFVELLLSRAADARAHFETALARNEPGAFLEVFRRWAWHDQLEEARQVLERAEQGLTTLSPHFYVDAAGACLSQTMPNLTEATVSLFGPPYTKKDLARSKRWETVGRELLAKAIAAAGHDLEGVLRHIISETTSSQPALALEYAQQLAALAPTDATGSMVLAFLQMVNGQRKESKDTLRKATRLARAQGDTALLAEIEQLRYMLSNPMFDMMGPMLPALLQSLGSDEEFYYDAP